MGADAIRAITRLQDGDDAAPGTPAKGDLFVFSAATGKYTQLPIGSDTFVLTADAAQTLGVKWAAAGGGGSSLPVVDTTAIAKGSADATKQVRLEVDGLTGGATRVVTVPDTNLTLAGVDVANTFTAGQTITNSATLVTTLKVVGASDGSTYSAGKIVDFQRADAHSMFNIDSASGSYGRATFSCSVSFDYGFTVNSIGLSVGASFSLIDSGGGADLALQGQADLYLQTWSGGNGDVNIMPGGTGITKFKGLSSTSAVRERAALAMAAVDNTDATRKYRGIFSVYDTAAREAWRAEASGSAPMIGFLGANAALRQTLNAAATDPATTMALVNQIRAALITFGLSV